MDRSQKLSVQPASPSEKREMGWQRLWQRNLAVPKLTKAGWLVTGTKARSLRPGRGGPVTGSPDHDLLQALAPGSPPAGTRRTAPPRPSPRGWHPRRLDRRHRARADGPPRPCQPRRQSPLPTRRQRPVPRHRRRSGRHPSGPPEKATRNERAIIGRDKDMGHSDTLSKWPLNWTLIRCRRGDLNPHALAGTSPSILIGPCHLLPAADVWAAHIHFPGSQLRPS